MRNFRYTHTQGISWALLATGLVDPGVTSSHNHLLIFILFGLRLALGCSHASQIIHTTVSQADEHSYRPHTVHVCVCLLAMDCSFFYDSHDDNSNGDSEWSPLAVASVIPVPMLITACEREPTMAKRPSMYWWSFSRMLLQPSKWTFWYTLFPCNTQLFSFDFTNSNLGVSWNHSLCPMDIVILPTRRIIIVLEECISRA